MNSASSAPLHRFAILVACFALLLNVAGSLVSSFQAAGSIPDWPLSYGHWFLQNWTGNTVYEYGHRLVAATTGLLALLLAIWMARKETLAALRGVAWMAVIIVAIQIVLGGVIVLLSSPPLIGILHVLLSQMFFALTFYLAVATSPRWIGRQASLDAGQLGAKQALWASLMMGLLFLQVLLGGASRYTTSQDLFTGVLMLHLANAAALLVVIHLACIGIFKAARGTLLAKACLGQMALLFLQVLVGIGVLVVAPEPFNETWPPAAGFPQMHAIHVATSSLMLALAVTISVSVSKLTAGREAA